MRVIAGTAKRCRLVGPAGRSIRPTPERVREALFSILAARIPKACFLDLFAGTGSVGIEALSRGAARVIFVERNERAVNLIRENLRRTGLAGPRAIVYQQDSLAALNILARKGERFDVIYIDPPYRKGYEYKALGLIATKNLLVPEGLAIAESDWRNELPQEIGSLVLWRRARYGDTLLSFYVFKEEAT
uniref:16S rRNA (Guanine(966)-N(2))-methyltransferase RsmD n=1 Tax=Ammonifex degensii TaxID=42838 RepID=A0A7C1FE60_9THEO